MMCLGTSYWADLDEILYGSSAEDAKDNGFIYSDMFYNSSSEDRRKEFNLRQILREEALKVWD
jgi:tRNA(Arg) A34 adenosine deaminase TadA